ncbi:MAG TPA: hypothetical protein VE133_10820, partial [Candidatus Sulfotelmatobacter sp.]|nr:hypothetical protein [Candidatus Sulfotelmatobacter sp.]
VLKYLETSGGNHISAAQIQTYLEEKGLRVVGKPDLECLARAEEQEAQRRGIPWFKFAQDEAMLAAIETEKTKAVTA